MRRPVLLCVLAALVPAAVALADLTVTVRNRDRVTASLVPPREVERYRLDVPAGARLRAVASPRPTADRRRPPDLRMRVLDPIGYDRTGSAVKLRNGAARLSGFVAESTGLYTFEVRGDGVSVGDYTFSARWTAASHRKQKAVPLSAAPTDVRFSAVAGSGVFLSARATKGSATRPYIAELVRELPGGGTTVVKTFSPPGGSLQAAVVKMRVDETGDYSFRVVTVENADGPADLGLRVDPERVRRRRLRATDAVLPAPPAGVVITETVFVEQAGGATAESGPRFALAADAVLRATAVEFGTAPAFDGPPLSGLLPAGAPVFVGPEALQYGRLSDVFVPYDTTLFGADTSSLRVVRRDASGQLTVLDAGSLVPDAADGTVKARIGRGGTYGAFRLVPAPQPTSITPFYGPAAGGTTVSIAGTGFRTERDGTGAFVVEVLVDGVASGAAVVGVTPTFVTFVTPPHAAGDVTFAVRDRETALSGALAVGSFEYQ